ncbi:MAG TPA: protein kinase [Vicinamibacterales bacterium]|nr:protein kinase [Vicinamibacterales bacterium]
MLAELIGHYRVVATLGSGGMGVVWKAIDTRLNRPVALKAIRESDPQNTDAVLRLRAEALAAASLDHPYICKIYELLETGDATIVVMEFVDGETLGDILDRCVPPLVDTLRYGSEIAEGLANAHARGIVHRDVKPSNVMVTQHGHIKLLDFGIARISNDLALTESALTLPGNIPGTPQYMAPEQALGRPLDGRADLFSLGVLLYRCLTGKLPFEGQTRDEYIQQMLAGRVGPLDELAPETPQAVRDIVMACLKVDPALRPESAFVVADTLRRTADALSTGTVPVATRAPRGLPGAAVMTAIGAGVLAIAAVAAYWWRPDGGDENVLRTLVPAVTWASSESGARVSPDGQWLSFVSDRQNQSRIFVQAIERADPVPVTIQGAALSHAWSPDSRDLAALVRQGDDQFLMVVPAFFGGTPRVSIPLDRRLTDVTVLRWIGDAVYLNVYLNVNRGQPGRSLLRVALASGAVDDVSAGWKNVPPVGNGIDVSPDGSRVVLAASVGPRTDLWTVATDGSDLRRLMDDDFTDRYPVWTSAATIVFESNRGGQLDLWQWSSSTGKLTSLTSSHMREMATGASSDGSTIAFEQTSSSVNLWRLDFGGSSRPDVPAGYGLRQLTADALSDYWPSASRDDGVVAFQRAKPTLLEGFQFFDSRVLLAPMKSDAPLEPQVVADGFSARLSPDGRWAAYYQRIPDRFHLRLVARNLQTGEGRTLSDRCVLPSLSATSLPVDFIQQNVTWSASGARLFYLVAGEKAHEIHSVDLDSPGEPSRLLSVGPGEASDIRLSSDGGSLAFLVRIKNPENRKSVSDLRVHNLHEQTTRIVTREAEAQPFPYLPGWSRADALILQRATLRPDQLYELELIEVGLDGTRRGLARVPDSVIPVVRIDPDRGRLFVTRSAAGIHNIHAMSLRDGSMRQVTSNQSPGVSFSGIHPLRADAIVFARDERKQDIWLVTRSVDR